MCDVDFKRKWNNYIWGTNIACCVNHEKKKKRKKKKKK